MDCPRCGLINPETAVRCDCGYDFKTKKVEQSYQKQELPKEIKTWLIVVIVANIISALHGIISANLITIVATLIYSTIVFTLYLQLVKKKNWARIALVILSFPVGLNIGLSIEAKLYCLQVEK